MVELRRVLLLASAHPATALNSSISGIGERLPVNNQLFLWETGCEWMMMIESALMAENGTPR